MIVMKLELSKLSPKKENNTFLTMVFDQLC